MPKLPWLVVLRVAVLIAIAASAALLSDYIADAPSFCSARSGCAAVRASAYAQLPLGEGKFVPLPALGLLGFVVLYVTSLTERRLMLLVATLGSGVALWLLAVQALVVKQFCWLCVTTDVATLVAGLAAWRARGAAFEDVAPRLRSWAWWGLGALALAGPLLWPKLKPSPAVPSGVPAYFAPGKINVVEFADFQCPACRRFHSVLKPTLEKYGDRVHFVRLNKPLASHAYAFDAARAAVCGEAQGKSEQTADALFSAHDLSPAGIDRIATELGLDGERFASCLSDPGTSARVEREFALLVPPELEGLPTTYIGGKRLLGVRSAEEVEDALARAARGEGETGVSAFVYIPTLLLLALALLRLGARRTLT
ncbi:MAG TPA: thioredoxin domain-containing protein [Polyangiaceae bacterium]